MDTNAGQQSGAPGSMSEEQFLDKLRNALAQDGDFPTSAKIVSELKMLTSNPNTTANQIAEVILREPSLGARVLHIVNSSFYHRSKPIMTISQAVMRIGMKPLAELCAGLVLLQKFGSISRRGHAFSRCLTKTVLTSLLSGSLTQKTAPPPVPGQPSDESGFLAGSLADMGTLLLAYYFPEIYENAVKRAETKRQSIEQSITEIVGHSPLALSLEVVTALNLPEFYKEILEALQKPHSKAPAAAAGVLPTDAQKIARAAGMVGAARDISETISSGKGKAQLDQTIAAVEKELKIDLAVLTSVVGDISGAFKEHCAAIDLNLPALPEFVSTYSDQPSAAPAAKGADAPEDRFMQFVDEIRQSVESRESSSSVITTVMETLAYGLDFERVILLLASAGKRTLAGRMALGQVGTLDPKKFERPIGMSAGPYAPDAKAFAESRPVFTGDSVLPDGWPFVAIPVGFGARAIGVIYADRTSTDGAELTSREQAAIGVLAELIDRSLALNG